MSAAEKTPEEIEAEARRAHLALEDRLNAVIARQRGAIDALRARAELRDWASALWHEIAAVGIGLGKEALQALAHGLIEDAMNRRGP